MQEAVAFKNALCSELGCVNNSIFIPYWLAQVDYIGINCKYRKMCMYSNLRN